MTKQRTAILTALKRSPGHYTADVIYEMAKTYYPTMSRATVYNNLSSLVEEGALSKIVGGGASAIYDTTSMPHAHAICTRCNRVEDLFLEQLDDQISKKLNVPFVSYDLTVKYVCPKCKHKLS